jgi:hypothetical protein
MSGLIINNTKKDLLTYIESLDENQFVNYKHRSIDITVGSKLDNKFRKEFANSIPVFSGHRQGQPLLHQYFDRHLSFIKVCLVDNWLKTLQISPKG